MSASKQISFEGVQRFLNSLFGNCLHAKRILSLAGATLGAIHSASMAVALIGQGLVLARGLNTKHAVKKVDRMLTNAAIDVDAMLGHWVPFIVGQQPKITVALDWTDFDADGQTTLMASSKKICGRRSARAVCQVHDTARFPRRGRCGSRRIFAWSLWPCC